MNLTRQEFDKLRPMPNKVVLKVEKYSNDTVTLKSGITLFIDTKHRPEIHVSQWFTVVKPPPNLFYKKHAAGGMKWKTELEIKPGDRVLCNFVSVSQAFGTLQDPHAMDKGSPDKVWFVEDDIYVVLQYIDLFYAERGEEKIMLNGYLLIEPVEKEVLQSKIILIPDSLKKKTSMKYGIVARKGSFIQEYEMLGHGDNCDVEIGDHVAFHQVDATPVEYGDHQSLDRKYFRMQRKDLLAIFPKDSSDEHVLSETGIGIPNLVIEEMKGVAQSIKQFNEENK